MGELFSVTKIVEYIVTAILLGTLFSLCSAKVLGGLQQTGYSSRRLFRWLKRKDNMLMTNLSLLAFLIFLAALVLGLCFFFLKDPAYLTLAPFGLFCLLYLYADRKYALKVPTVQTHRFVRLEVVYFLLVFLAAALLVVGLNVLAYFIPFDLVGRLRYVPLAIFPLLLPYLAAVANFLDKLFEIPRNNSYVKKAEKALTESSMIKIGITGSFGKTTVKNILKSVLSEKYRVLATPSSYNTPLGIARTVNEVNLEDYDVFLAEMGARHSGDIEKLCDLVMPDYSVITGICPQHLQSFGSVENIVRAKGEILYGTQHGAVMGRDEYTERLYNTSPVETLLIGDEVGFSDVKTSANGTSFVLRIEEETKLVRTKLLGAGVAEDMAVAAGLAYLLDFTIDQIVAGLEKTDYIPHRLQPLVEGGVTVLDDSYNANVKGAKSSVEVLQLFSGRKVVVTPGLVELGILEQQENEKVGESLVGLDLVILVGDTLVSILKKGYLAAGGDAEKLKIVPTLKAAQEILQEYLQSGDTVLFLNDLPDVYNL